MQSLSSAGHVASACSEKGYRGQAPQYAHSIPCGKVSGLVCIVCTHKLGLGEHGLEGEVDAARAAARGKGLEGLGPAAEEVPLEAHHGHLRPPAKE